MPLLGSSYLYFLYNIYHNLRCLFVTQDYEAAVASDLSVGMSLDLKQRAVHGKGSPNVFIYYWPKQYSTPWSLPGSFMWKVTCPSQVLEHFSYVSFMARNTWLPVTLCAKECLVHTRTIYRTSLCCLEGEHVNTPWCMQIHSMSVLRMS